MVVKPVWEEVLITGIIVRANFLALKSNGGFAYVIVADRCAQDIAAVCDHGCHCWCLLPAGRQQTHPDCLFPAAPDVSLHCTHELNYRSFGTSDAHFAV